MTDIFIKSEDEESECSDLEIGESTTLEESLDMTQSSINEEIFDMTQSARKEAILDTTVSATKEAKIRTRTSSKWICIFQIMNPTKEMICQSATCATGSFDVTRKASVEAVDQHLKNFFLSRYNNAKNLNNNTSEVLYCLGGRYICHPKDNIIIGIVVLETRTCKNPGFNCHLLVEKSSPDTPPCYKGYHKTLIGHAYPIHTTDISCIGGNSLRALLKNWVNEKFFDSLHWVIPPSSSSMRKINPSEADIRDEEALQGFIELIKEMKDMLKTYRESLDQNQTDSVRKSQKTRSSPAKGKENRSMMEFLQIIKGKEYSVKAHHWQVIEVPLKSNGKIDNVAYRSVTSIKEKGGVIKRISKIN